jgi:hypothetical protein
MIDIGSNRRLGRDIVVYLLGCHRRRGLSRGRGYSWKLWREHRSHALGICT